MAGGVAAADLEADFIVNLFMQKRVWVQISQASLRTPKKNTCIFQAHPRIKSGFHGM